MENFKTLPVPPEAMTATNVLVRIIDAIGFRYALATEGLTKKEADFRPVEGSMNMIELLNHIYRVLFWSYTAFNKEVKPNKSLKSVGDHREETLALCAAYKAFIQDLSVEDLEKTKVYLRRTDTTYSFWYLINGPITDALTHIGQINSWRRMAGNPCPQISPFTGESY